MRTVLYANENLSSYLRKNFVLCWQSERPVPVVTIDFGDGRVVKRTVTGNAAHYVLDHNENLLDVIPGIYSAKSFTNVLQKDFQLWQRLNRSHPLQHKIILEAHHAQQLHRIRQKWSSDFHTVQQSENPRKASLAVQAVERAQGKSIVELPLVKAIEPLMSPSLLQEETTPNRWEQIARLHQKDAKLDRGSQRLVEWLNPVRRTFSKRRIESPVLRIIRKFERSLAVDTVRNEYEFHSQIHQWFCEGEWKKGLQYFNDRVYREIFLTPADKPLLDLGNSYTGLSENFSN